MRDVVLLYERSCPNVAAARANLMRAFSRARVAASWREVDLDASDTPASWRTFGSPTILVDATDVVNDPPAQGGSCRLYRTADGLAGAPSVETITQSLLREPKSSDAKPRATSVLGALPGLGIALLPKGLCPACWPAYGALLSALGLGFLMQDEFLLPLTIVFLALAVCALAYRARWRRGFGPTFVGACAAVVLVVGKFVVNVPALAYVAFAAFGVAAVWNVWPVPRAKCGACVPTSLSS